jgi:hypothetical protein
VKQSQRAIPNACHHFFTRERSVRDATEGLHGCDFEYGVWVQLGTDEGESFANGVYFRPASAADSDNYCYFFLRGILQSYSFQSWVCLSREKRAERNPFKSSTEEKS